MANELNPAPRYYDSNTLDQLAKLLYIRNPTITTAPFKIENPGFLSFLSSRANVATPAAFRDFTEKAVYDLMKYARDNPTEILQLAEKVESATKGLEAFRALQSNKKEREGTKDTLHSIDLSLALLKSTQLYLGEHFFAEGVNSGTLIGEYEHNRNTFCRMMRNFALQLHEHPRPLTTHQLFERAALIVESLSHQETDPTKQKELHLLCSELCTMRDQQGRIDWEQIDSSHIPQMSKEIEEIILSDEIDNIFSHLHTTLSDSDLTPERVEALRNFLLHSPQSISRMDRYAVACKLQQAENLKNLENPLGKLISIHSPKHRQLIELLQLLEEDVRRSSLADEERQPVIELIEQMCSRATIFDYSFAFRDFAPPARAKTRTHIEQLKSQLQLTEEVSSSSSSSTSASAPDYSIRLHSKSVNTSWSEVEIDSISNFISGNYCVEVLTPSGNRWPAMVKLDLSPLGKLNGAQIAQIFQFIKNLNESFPEMLEQISAYRAQHRIADINPRLQKLAALYNTPTYFSLNESTKAFIKQAHETTIPVNEPVIELPTTLQYAQQYMNLTPEQKKLLTSLSVNFVYELQRELQRIQLQIIN